MNKKPLVSIIIPTSNRSRTIDRAIRSCISQSYPKIEIIIIDDNSTDNTKLIVNKLSKEGHRIKYYLLQHSVGSYQARIQGIKHSNGDLLAFLDSDDQLTLDSLASRIKYIPKGQEKIMVYGNVTINSEIRQFVQLEGNIYPYLMRELSICPINSLLVTRESALSAIDSSFNANAWTDDALLIELSKQSNVIYCPKSVAIQHISPDSISTNYDNLKSGLSELLKLYGSDIKKYHGYFRLFLWKVRLFRLSILKYKDSLIKSSKDGSGIKILHMPAILLIRIFMYILDMILRIWFDNIFV